MAITIIGNFNSKEVIHPMDSGKGKKLLKKILRLFGKCKLETILNHEIDNRKITIFLPEYNLAYKLFSQTPLMMKGDSIHEKQSIEEKERAKYKKLLKMKYNIKLINFANNYPYDGARYLILKRFEKIRQDTIQKQKQAINKIKKIIESKQSIFKKELIQKQEQINKLMLKKIEQLNRIIETIKWEQQDYRKQLNKERKEKQWKQENDAVTKILRDAENTGSLHREGQVDKMKISSHSFQSNEAQIPQRMQVGGES